jgi:Family of unknown function (DUF6644)
MLWEFLEPVANWMGNTGLALWLGASTGRIAWLFILHLSGLTMLLGTTLLLNLRLLGLAFKKQPVSELRREFGTWNLAGLGLMILSGMLIFMGGEASYFYGVWFRTKMEILLIALIFHFTLFRILTKAPENHFAPLWYKLTGAVSLLLWFGVAVAGRTIAYF